ncbi:MAG: phosphatidylinositol mannoside acyltransferase [Actinomycetota bacterium]
MSIFSPRVALFKSISTLLEVMPERFDTWSAVQIAEAMGRILPNARHHLSTNVQHALDFSNSVDSELVERFVNRAFASYGTYWAESAKLPAISAKVIRDRFVVSEGFEYFSAAARSGSGLVVALPHIGNWEWGGAYLSQIGYPMTAVAEALEPPELFEWFRAKREAMGIAIEPLDEHAGTSLLSVLRSGGIVGLLCDRDIQNNGIEVEFFGERVTMPAGPATLALRTGATLIAAACYSGPGLGHHAVMTRPIDCTRTKRLRDDVTRVTQAVAFELEGLIRRAPEQWHVLQPRFEVDV